MSTLDCAVMADRSPSSVTISTPLTPPQVLARWDALIRTCAGSRRFAANRSGSTLRLRYTPSVGRSELRPQAVAVVESARAGSDIRVVFQFAPAAQPTLKGGWVLGTVWTVIATAIAAFQPQRPMVWLLPLGGVTVLGLGALVVRVAKAYYRDDETRLVRTITDALGG